MRPVVHLLVAVTLLLLVTTLPGIAATADDTAARVAQARALLTSEQGAALLDLLGDPRVRQAILQDTSAPPRPAEQATAGEMMDGMLSSVRARLHMAVVEFEHLPETLAQAWSRLREQLPGTELARSFGLLVVFLIGAVGAQKLFFLIARPWRNHFALMALTTARQRLVAAAERILFAVLLIAAYAAGSMGTFLLFAWPQLTGSIILGYLVAFLIMRLSLVATRFFLAPGAPHLRLVPMDTATAWFWHHWCARITATLAIGWQTIVALRMLEMPEPQLDGLLYLVLLLIACLGIFVVWAAPRANGAVRHRHGHIPRLLLSFALLLDWLLFLMGARQFACTLLILGAIPVITYVLNRSVTIVILGTWTEDGASQSAEVAIAHRAIQALVVVLAATALVQVWQIDVTEMSQHDMPMTRVARGLLEALVILVISDLLWQVVRMLIDARLNGPTPLVDDLDDDTLRRRARLHTLLPVLRNFAFFVVLIMASLSALAAMGLQIGPLLAGAGVVGIAVGFGAQTLVRDILSGVFFLLDDAFRVGEIIESGGIVGTVESFSLRSVKLRHFSGQLHTVSFGDLKAITNYSRDWVVVQLQLMVIYDTDLDLLERTVEQVSQELMHQPAMAAQMIEPLRSLGVQAMLDTGMQIGLTFKTRPGHQFAVRRVVFGLIKSAFAANRIRFSTAVVLASGSADAPA